MTTAKHHNSRDHPLKPEQVSPPNLDHALDCLVMGEANQRDAQKEVDLEISGPVVNSLDEEDMRGPEVNYHVHQMIIDCSRHVLHAFDFLHLEEHREVGGIW